MTNTSPDTVLKRMAEAGRGYVRPAPPTPARAFGQAFTKAAQDVLGLPVTVREASDLRATLLELPELLAERALLAVLDGPDGGQGLVALSQEGLASVIEMQTTGRIGAAAVVPRRPTRTDAAMSSRFLDRVLSEFELQLGSDAAIVWAGGFRYRTFLDDPRPLGLMFEETLYRVLRLTIGYGGEGARQGSLLLAVPAEGRGALPTRTGPAAGERLNPLAAAAQAEWSAR